MMKKLIVDTNFGQLLEWLNDAYDYDATDLKANTEKDEAIKKQIEQIELLKQAFTINPQQNV
jgi:hypothetical protein